MKNLKHSALLAFWCLLASFQVLYAQSEGVSREEWQEQMKTEELKISAYVNEQLLNSAQNERIKQSFLTSENYHHDEVKEVNTQAFIDNYLKSFYREQYLKLHPEVVKVYNPGRVSAPAPAKAATTTIVCSDGDFEAGYSSLSSFNGYVTNSYYGGECSFVPPTSVGYTYLGPLPGSPENFELTNNMPDPIVPAINQTHNGSAHALRINAPIPCTGYLNAVNMLQKTFSSSTSGRSRINFSYALVMEDPTHVSPPQNPFFVVRVLDNTGIEVARFCKVADMTDPFFQSVSLSVCGYSQPGVYRDWDCEFLEFDMVAYTNYTIEFFVADCGAGGHFAYAYVDDICVETCYQTIAPRNLRCNPIINGPYYGSVLAWDPIPGAVSYIVTIHERDSSCCRPDSLTPPYIYDLSVTGTSKMLVDTIPHCFSWSVVAVMPGGKLSLPSEPMCSCTPSGPPPYNLRCYPDGSGSRLSWNPVPGAVSYKVSLYAYNPACCPPNPLYPSGFVSDWMVSGTIVTVPATFADCFSWTVVGVMSDGSETVISETKCSCGVSISFMKEDGSGIMNQNERLQVRAIPNPASEYVKFKVNSKQEGTENLTLHLFDLSGRELLSKPLDQNGALQIDVRPYLSGVYVYEIRSKEKTIYKDKILIEKQ